MLAYKDLLVQILGLEPTATDDEISAAAATFQSDMTSFEAEKSLEVANMKKEKDELSGQVTTLTNARNTLLAELVDADLERYAPVITDKEAIREGLLSNRASTLSVLKGLRVAQGDGAVKPVHNDKLANRKPLDPSAEHSTADVANAKKIANRAKQIQKEQGIGYHDAFKAAEKEAVLA